MLVLLQRYHWNRVGALIWMRALVYLLIMGVNLYPDNPCDTQGSADRSWYSDARKTFLFLRLTAPLRSRVPSLCFTNVYKFQKQRNRWMIGKSKQKVNIACLTYQPSPKKKLQGKNYRSNTLYANVSRNFYQSAKLFCVHSLWRWLVEIRLWSRAR